MEHARTWLLLALWSASPAAAHGPAPSILEVLEIDAQGNPSLVRTSHGLLARDRSTMRLLCASLHGGDAFAPMAVDPEGRLATVSLGGATLSDPTRTRFERSALETDFAIRDVASTAEGFSFLARERTPEGLGASVWIAPSGAIHRLPIHPDDLFATPEVALAIGSDPPTLCELRNDGADEAPVRCLPLAVEAEWSAASLRFADSSVVVVSAAEGRTRRFWMLERSTGRMLEGPSGDVLHGPVQRDGELVVLVDRVLHVRRDDVWERIDDPRAARWSGLTQVGSAAFATALDELLTLDDVTVLTMDQARSPDAAHVEDCDAEWAHYAWEVGVDLEDASTGCASVGGPPRATLGWWLALGLVRRRPRERSNGCANDRSHDRSHERSNQDLARRREDDAPRVRYPPPR